MRRLGWMHGAAVAVVATGLAGSQAIGGAPAVMDEGLEFSTHDQTLPLILAQSTGDPGGGGGGSEGSSGGDSGGTVGGGGGGGSSSRASTITSADEPANAATTRTIERRLREVEDNCGRLVSAYRIDCVAQEFRELANDLPRRGDYAEARDALDTVARQLEQIARSNRDRQQARLRLNVSRAGTGRTERTRPITAVRENTLPSAAQQARQVIERGKVQLLRSTSASDPRRAHYQRIAAAFDESAVLLRS